MRYLLTILSICIIGFGSSSAMANDDGSECSMEGEVEICCHIPSHCTRTGYFEDSEDAQAACIECAAAYNYGPSSCIIHQHFFQLDQPRWAAGWLLNDKDTNDKSAFWFCQFYFELPCPSFGDGFWVDWDTGECTCTDDSLCDDGLVCNGQETCDPLNGGCAPGTPLDCSDPDALSCTPGSCEEPIGCVNEPADEALCVCEESEAEPLVTSMPQLSISELAVSCPIIGGSASASAQVSGEYSLDPPTCANACTGSASAEAALNVGISLCGEGGANTKSVGLKGAYARNTQACTTCDDASCELVCEAPGCIEESISGGVNLGVTQGVGLKLGPKRFFGAEWHAYITGQISGSASLEGSRSETSGALDCADCEACTAGNSELSIGGSVVASARVSGGLFGKKVNLALENLAHLSVDASAKNTSACDGVACVQNEVKVSSGVRVPIPAENIVRFWGLREGKNISCAFSVEACAESNGCGSCTACEGCAESRVNATCGITKAEGGAP